VGARKTRGSTTTKVTSPNRHHGCKQPGRPESNAKKPTGGKAPMRSPPVRLTLQGLRLRPGRPRGPNRQLFANVYAGPVWVKLACARQSISFLNRQAVWGAKLACARQSKLVCKTLGSAARKNPSRAARVGGEQISRVSERWAAGDIVNTGSNPRGSCRLPLQGGRGNKNIARIRGTPADSGCRSHCSLGVKNWAEGESLSQSRDTAYLRATDFHAGNALQSGAAIGGFCFPIKQLAMQSTGWKDRTANYAFQALSIFFPHSS
jgi:hypothetical protein